MAVKTAGSRRVPPGGEDNPSAPARRTEGSGPPGLRRAWTARTSPGSVRRSSCSSSSRSNRSARSRSSGATLASTYRLTATLLTTGHLPSAAAYAGWGFAYSEFPGLFEISAATAGATGAGVLPTLQVVAPVLSALAVVPLFLAFRRFVANDTVAILGATLGALFMPRIFSVAHPAPLALGDFFVIAMVWMFLESRREVRWYLPLGVTAGALIVTHHLSMYFFLVSALGLVVLTELVWPRRWSVRFPLREFVLLGVVLTGALAYWFLDAHAFSAIASSPIPGLTLTFPLVEAASVVGLAVLAGLVALRRKVALPRAHRLKFPSDRSVVRDALVLLVGIYGGLALLIAVPLPGTMGQTATVAALVFFTPLLLAIVLTSGSRRLLAFSRDGPLALMWVLAIGVSAILALSLGRIDDLPGPPRRVPRRPARTGHRCLPRPPRRSRQRPGGRPAAIAAAVAVVVLVGANAAIAYPPAALLGGFQEGLTNGDAAVWMWTGSPSRRTTRWRATTA